MEENKKEETVCVRIRKSTHAKAKDHLGIKTKIGAYTDEALIEKIEKEKKEKPKK